MAIKSPKGSIIDVPRGTQDLGTKESITLKEILSVTEEIFKRFGFSPIITPSIENTEVLNANAYGEESTKEMYVMEGGDIALRFDFTVPLARFMAMNKDIPLPFKRYQIGTVWRKDEPQHMRSREFMQADIDIVGSTDLSSDIEIIAASLRALEALQIKDCLLLINSRPLLNLILEHFKIPKEKQNDAIRIFDKISKISMTDTISQLKALGIADNDAQSMIAFITEKMTNNDKLNKLEVNIPESKPETEKLRSTLIGLEKYGLKEEVRIDLSLARGLDYYTGMIWEVVIETAEGMLPSISSGGRYDGLIGLYSKSGMPAVGTSIGISRVFEILNARSASKTYAKVFIAQIGADSGEYSTGVANRLRDAGIYADLNVTDRGISKQLEYSSSMGIRYVAIIGSKEKESGKVKLRDMQSGTEELLDIDAAIALLKK